jgi:hypothetical protein
MQSEGGRTSRVVAPAFLVGLFFVAQEALVQLAAGRPVPVANDVEASGFAEHRQKNEGSQDYRGPADVGRILRSSGLSRSQDRAQDSVRR